jgi:hypothetical protein
VLGDDSGEPLNDVLDVGVSIVCLGGVVGVVGVLGRLALEESSVRVMVAVAVATWLRIAFVD